MNRSLTLVKAFFDHAQQFTEADFLPRPCGSSTRTCSSCFTKAKFPNREFTPPEPALHGKLIKDSDGWSYLTQKVPRSLAAKVRKAY